MSTTSADAKDSFHVPIRTILTREDLEQFQSSPACLDLQEFIWSLNESVREKTLLADIESSEVSSWPWSLSPLM